MTDLPPAQAPRVPPEDGPANPASPTEHDHGTATSPSFYVARVAVSGGGSAHGRATGRARSADGVLDLELRVPAELGGDATGPDPEQLFAAAYAACFHGALSLLARRHRLDPGPITVEAAVALGRDPADGGYRLRADLVVTWPGVGHDAAAPLLAQAATLCPYAKMTRHGIPATITLAPEP
ncbi:peroxiredoxin [Sphaerisporangium siamense]|uniref:Ohr subfamily peroxiredoxin n=1 Tax=Sphaerisporangium siamense TaxID=795645 RepID=A0A7W7GBP0_9ACTN|nr:Ohr family peroxiredoxin [Sphaerisporangium siamense]MBB4703702.1 Ohr subfamily peroxiredoxin [Sphaerisporangium siamense]GII82174.1 peroxiredoxin [Sphaerisporangium siamense]